MPGPMPQGLADKMSISAHKTLGGKVQIFRSYLLFVSFLYNLNFSSGTPFFERCLDGVHRQEIIVLLFTDGAVCASSEKNWVYKKF